MSIAFFYFSKVDGVGKVMEISVRALTTFVNDNTYVNRIDKQTCRLTDLQIEWEGEGEEERMRKKTDRQRDENGKRDRGMQTDRQEKKTYRVTPQPASTPPHTHPHAASTGDKSLTSLEPHTVRRSAVPVGPILSLISQPTSFSPI